MTDWKTEYCATQPDELQIIGKGLYIQRRNIREATHQPIYEGDELYTGWECESREVTFTEYRQMMTDIEVERSRADIDYIAMMSDIDLEEG